MVQAKEAIFPEAGAQGKTHFLFMHSGEKIINNLRLLHIAAIAEGTGHIHYRRLACLWRECLLTKVQEQSLLAAFSTVHKKREPPTGVWLRKSPCM